MTGLATATFPDGSLPPVEDVMKIASNLFAAGQETTARLLGTALQTLAERPELQQQLRDDRCLVSPFIEETLRLEPPINGTFRLSRTPTTVQDTEIPAGSTVMVLPSGANRDPREFEHPDELRLDRENARQHIAFGHGIHTCAGAPLARAESNVSLQRLLDRMADIRISDSHHGPAGAPPLGVHAHLDAPRPRPALPRVHAHRLSVRSCHPPVVTAVGVRVATCGSSDSIRIALPRRTS